MWMYAFTRDPDASQSVRLIICSFWGGFWTLGGVTTRDPSLYERALRHRRTVAATGNFSPLTALVSHRHLTCEMGVKVT